jgi:zinc/manganese transport system substrate-binding protein
MNTLLSRCLGVALAGLFLVTHAFAAEKIRVITTIPDLAEFAKAIGGDLAEVESLATGVEDPHGVPMKPSFVTKLNRAHLVVLIGIENEHAYLPGLLEAANNPRIQYGQPGYIDTSRGIQTLEVPRSLDRVHGETHPAGNPHYNLDPVLAKTMLTNICAGFIRNYPQHEAVFMAGRDAYIARLDAKLPEWEALAARAPGLKFVSYHSHWPYFARRFGFRHMGTIEFKPGISPTPKHVESLIKMMKAEDVRVVVREPQYAERVPRQVAAKTGSKLVKLAIMVGGVPEAKTYMEMIDYNLRTLVEAAPSNP